MYNSIHCGNPERITFGRIAGLSSQAEDGKTQGKEEDATLESTLNNNSACESV